MQLVAHVRRVAHNCVKWTEVTKQLRGGDQRCEVRGHETRNERFGSNHPAGLLQCLLVDLHAVQLLTNLGWGSPKLTKHLTGSLQENTLSAAGIQNTCVATARNGPVGKVPGDSHGGVEGSSCLATLLIFRDGVQQAAPTSQDAHENLDG